LKSWFTGLFQNHKLSPLLKEVYPHTVEGKIITEGEIEGIAYSM